MTHFVIDMVAGRESVLWRVFVAADAGEAVLGLPPVKPAAGEAKPSSAIGARASTRGIRYTLAATEHVERFSKCAAAGCMMEANLLHAGEVATSLWDGNDIGLAITLSSGRIIQMSLPARGFRAGLAALVRLRRDESRSARR